MKTFFIAIFMFILGFVIWGGMWINFSLNTWYDYLLKSVWNVSELPKNATQNMKLMYEKKKAQLIKEFTEKKDQIIKQIKENIKEQLKKQIENMFN